MTEEYYLNISFIYLKIYPELFFFLGILILKTEIRGFPGGTVVKNPPANAGSAEKSSIILNFTHLITSSSHRG